ncbi:hypothetical protein AB6A40_008670 [Gnathostoma spinigerum]|uniref:CR032 protein n=1 Tax=Gnathostoma spinigerum TaxID=75299 RepID=A0ABD6ERL6_9BILA
MTDGTISAGNQYFHSGKSSTMVCIPCIILPVILFIYIRFIQPLVLRLLPPAWMAKFDAIFYPTCPARPPSPSKKEQPVPSMSSDSATAENCVCSTGDKKNE